MNISYFINSPFWQNTSANTLGTLMATLVIFIFTYWIIKPVQSWVYRQNPRIAIILQQILLIIGNSWLRGTIFALSILLIYFDWWKNYFSFGMSILMFLTFFKSKNMFSKLSFPSSTFSDEFKSIEEIRRNWETVTGNIDIDKNDGQPQPSLWLERSEPREATNTFLLVKNLETQSGIIECDIKLGQDSLFNIVFFCNKTGHNWHMARWDTRRGTSDGFLIKTGGPGQNWRINNMVGTQTTPGSWHKVRVEFSNEKAKMFRDGELLAEITNPQMFGQQIGFFNECGEVRVDNFTFSET